MALLIVALLGVVDTLELPKPASAIAILGDSSLAYLLSTADELYAQSNQGGWQSFPLPQRFRNVQRLLVDKDLCYILADRTLTLCDLRSSREGVVAEGIDDAVLTPYGELWLLSDFTLVKTTPLGRELERYTLSYPAQSLWMIADSLYSVDKQHPLVLPQAFKDEIQAVGLPLDLTTSPANFAPGDMLLFYLLDSRHVLRIRR